MQASVRTAYRCEKQPTGGLNRDSLINYINEEGIKAPDKEEMVPFELGKKRGKVWMTRNIILNQAYMTHVHTLSGLRADVQRG